MPRLLPAVLLLLVPAALGAQGLPSFAPVNPVATARSGLGFEPYRDPAPERWRVALAVDYASTIEYNQLARGAYYLDSEQLRVGLGVRRDLGPQTFVLADAELRGAYDGFLDGFLDWYHGLIGITVPERERRPRDQFLYAVSSPEALFDPEPSDVFLGDLRIGVGRRWTRQLQTIAAVTLPTSTGPEGYGKGVASISLFNTARFPLDRRLVYEGSVSAGYTARHGGLEALQREWLVAASSGLRLALWGRHSLYGNVFYHSPYYQATGLPSLDRRELSFDFGWILARGPGAEWRLGMTEDLEPGGPAIDLIFRLGVAF